MSLENHLSTILGVVEPPRVAKVATKTIVPSRPDPQYEYKIRVSRTEYGTVFLTAASETDAQYDVDFAEVDWTDSGDTEVEDIDCMSDEPENQDEIDEWEDAYGHKYDSDGDPKCSDCLDNCDESDLTTDPDDPDAWYCHDCAPNHLSHPDAL